MTNEKLRYALALLAAQNTKLLAKPKRDAWDRFATFVPLLTGLLVTATSLFITFRIQTAQTHAAEAKKNAETVAANERARVEEAAATERARVESEAIQREKEFQQRLARTELLSKMIPFLAARDATSKMAVDAVALTNDADLMTAVSRMLPPEVATPALARVTENAGASEAIRSRASSELGEMARSSAQDVETWGARALVIAAGELKEGVREKPPGTNRGPRVDEYSTSLGYPPGQPWSGIFVAWCFKKALPASQKPPFKFAPGFAQIKADILTAGRWHSAGAYPPKPGDIVIYKPRVSGPPTHGGILVSVDAGSVTAIEGNTTGSTGLSDLVAARTRPISDVLGFADMGVEMPSPPNPNAQR